MSGRHGVRVSLAARRNTDLEPSQQTSHGGSGPSRIRFLKAGDVRFLRHGHLLAAIDNIRR